MNSKNALIFEYACGTLLVQDKDDVDATAKKLLKRLEEIDQQYRALRRERDSITTALSVAGFRPPQARQTIYTGKETQYEVAQPFLNMPLIDACLSVLKDHSHDWLDKNQVEYLIVRGGYKFDTEDSINSVSVSLRRLATDGFCEAQRNKGSRSNRYRFKRDRESNDVNSRATSETNQGER